MMTSTDFGTPFLEVLEMALQSFFVGLLLPATTWLLGSNVELPLGPKNIIL